MLYKKCAVALATAVRHQTVLARYSKQKTEKK
jgi:hypothetical protein